MPKFKKTWFHVVPGDKYKRQFNTGEDCPETCVDAAAKDGVIDLPKPKRKPKAEK
ncbi:hypothetical protein [Ruegeria jejuensis]|uniref:hypothetical protein n=1 Tax=Ruegeria jejuensis TaxID=3233338 RepID=UPI00355C33CE